MKKIILSVFLLAALSARSQNLPACDSLVINCCTFDSVGQNTLTLYASNHSSVLFDYPGFVLLDNAMDTIAKETVNYFGIGGGPQPHTLNIVAPLNLPFTGYLNLYTLFYVSLDCSFPFYIPDTVNGVRNLDNAVSIKLSPNPAAQFTTIEAEGFDAGGLTVSLYDISGRVVRSLPMEGFVSILPLQDLNRGFYLLKVSDRQLHTVAVRKLMVVPGEIF